jgi:hypothetical protein
VKEKKEEERRKSGFEARTEVGTGVTEEGMPLGGEGNYGVD